MSMLLQGAGSSSLPRQLPAGVVPLAWYKADDIGLSDGTAVGTWPDSSGNSRDLTAAGTQRPLVQSAGINGKPCLLFDGVNDFMSSAAFATARPTEWYVVGNWIGAAVGGSMVDGKAGAGANFNVMQRFAATSVVIYDGGSALAATTTPTVPHQYTASYQSSVFELRVDGSGSSSGLTGGQSAGGVSVGANHDQGAGTFGNFLIAEIVVVGTTANRAAIEAYLKSFWGTP